MKSNAICFLADEEPIKFCLDLVQAQSKDLIGERPRPPSLPRSQSARARAGQGRVAGRQAGRGPVHLCGFWCLVSP